MTGKLDLDPPGGGRGGPVGRAGGQAKPVIEMARTRTTVSVARATLRLDGLSRADPASLSAGEGAGTRCCAGPRRSGPHPPPTCWPHRSSWSGPAAPS